MRLPGQCEFPCSSLSQTETKWPAAESYDGIVMQVARLILAIVLLVAMWGLSVMRAPNSQPWVRANNVQPGPVHILRFYASVGTLVPGQHAQLCYSVQN